MVFKMVTDSEKLAGRIAGNASSHAARMSEDLTERWRHRLPEGQRVIDVHQLQLALGEELRVLRSELLEKEQLHKDRLEEVREARQRRDAATPALRDVLYRTRDLFKTVYDEQGPWVLFGEKPQVPVDPVPLRRVACRVLKRLADPGLELPSPRYQGVTTKPSDLAPQIEKPLAVLDETLDHLQSALAGANASLEEKQKAHAELDELNRLGAPFLEATYRLAGHDVIAARVRRSSHRSSDSDPEAPEETETAPADDIREATEKLADPIVAPSGDPGERREAASTSEVTRPASRVRPQPPAERDRTAPKSNHPSSPGKTSVGSGRVSGFPGRRRHRPESFDAILRQENLS